MTAATALADRVTTATDAEIAVLAAKAQRELRGEQYGLVRVSITDMLATEPEPVHYLVEPWLPEAGLAMVYGPSGVAKSYFVQGLAVALAQGTGFLKWTIPAPARALYIDGEMGRSRLHPRFKMLTTGNGLPLKAGIDVISCSDQYDKFVPDLAEPVNQLALLDEIETDTRLVILDNLSCLTSMLDDNDAGSWESMQRFIVGLRNRGIAVILVHHANKGGEEQAGTGRRVHVLDTVISLRWHRNPDGQTPGYHEAEVHFTKTRGMPPGAAEPFVATLAQPCGMNALEWTWADLQGRKANRIEEMLVMGMSAGEVATETGSARSYIYRIRDRLKAAGKLKGSKS